MREREGDVYEPARKKITKPNEANEGRKRL